MRIRLLLLLLALFPTALLAQAAEPPRPISHEDLWLAPRVGAPVVSPDGRRAVVAVAQPAYDKEENASHLWLVATDGKEAPRQITSLRGGESGASWSADGQRIAFSAKRDDDEQAQIYVLDLARGGEAQRVTSISTGAKDPLFSPDGTRIAFTTEVHPSARNDEDSVRISEEEAERKYKVHAYSGFPIRYWDRWLTERQPRLMVQVLGDDVATDLLAATELVKMPGYMLRGGSLNAAWAPDGNSLVFAASRNLHRSAHDFTHADLWQVSADGEGELRRLTGDEGLEGGDSWGSPAFGPGGDSLYALRRPRTDRVYNATTLVRLDWPSATESAEIHLPEKRAVQQFVVSPNGREVFMVGHDAGHTKLWKARSRGGEGRLAFPMERGVYGNLSLSRSGRPVLLANFQSAVSPAEVVRIDLGRGGHTPLTSFAADVFAGLDLQQPEHFWFESEEGARIHNMLVKPAGFDPGKRYPLVVLMHGGPHSLWREQVHLRWNYHLIAGSEFVVLATNYTGSTGFGEDFAQAIQGDPLRGPAEEINQGADEAIARYDFIDGTRQCAVGASYGGHLANWMQVATDRYHCLVSHAGLTDLGSQWGTSDAVYHREVNVGGPPWEGHPLWRDQSPITYAGEWETPMLVTAGALDYRVPLNNTLELWTVLQRRQIESRLLVYPEENHWIMSGYNSRHFYGELGDWLGRWLLEEEAEAQ